MITFDPGAGMPTHWVLVFDRRGARPWMDRVPFVGPYKHVRAFGHVAAVNTWIFFDTGLHGLEITAARGDAARTLMAQWLADADAVGMPATPQGAYRVPWFGWCVPSVKRLIGFRSGALRPIGLMRDCLRHGGELIEPAVPATATAGPIRPAAAAAGED